MDFQRVARRDDLWSGEIAGADVNGEPVLLVHLDDQIYAYADVCPHQRSRLSEGTLTGKIIRCERHHWEFDVCTGSGVNPRNACLRKFPVRLDGEYILVCIDTAGVPGVSVDRKSKP